MPEFKDLSKLLDPQSVAIVGVSPRTGASARIRENIQRFNFPGEIYLVNPRYETLWGEKCYASLDDLPETVDNAIFCVPAPTVVSLLEKSTGNHFRAAIVRGADFGEDRSPEGLKRKAFLEDFARAHEVRFCGPNCMGLVSMRAHAFLFPETRFAGLREGGLAIVSQSGGLVGGLFRAATGHGMGLSYVVSGGNEVDAELADYINHFFKDEQTRVIAAFVEGVKDAEKFIDVARRAAAQSKPIIVLKIGSSPKGVEAALAHTGSLAGDDRLFDAASQCYGVIRARDIDELFNTAELFLNVNRLPEKKGAVFITFSGGLKGLMSDLAYDCGLALPDLAPDTVAQLDRLLGIGTSVGNPLDTGFSGLSSQETLLKCIVALIGDPNIPVVALQAELPQSDTRPETESNLMELAKIAERSPKPLVAFAMATQNLNDYGLEFKARCRLPFLESAQNSVRALAHLGNYSSALKRMRGDENQSSTSVQPLTTGAKEILSRTKIITEWRAYQVLAEYGVPIAKTILTMDVAGAVKAAGELGYPVAVKVAAANATHKTELGGIRLGLKDDAAVERACREIANALSKARPEISLDGFLIQEMIDGGVEAIIGTINSPEYGPAIMFGLGGMFVEVYQDVIFRLAPVTHEEALEMIGAIKGYPLLTGFRGAPPVDVESLAAVLVRVSELASAASDIIQSLDINPFIALPQGGKAVDALIVTRKTD